MERIGKLYGIGVGPGDPELITLKAVNVLKEVDVVFAASSTKNDHSMALDIALKYIPEQTQRIVLSFPMVVDPEETKKYWLSHTKKILQELYKGKNAAFLTVGDPLTFSTFGYILRSIKETDPLVEIKIVPGITSYQAAAAVSNTVLVEGEETLSIVSGIKGGDHLRKLSQLSENIVFLKAYKNIDDIYLALREKGRLKSSLAVIRCGFEDEEIVEDLEVLKEKRPRYWTLIISKKGTSKGISDLIRDSY